MGAVRRIGRYALHREIASGGMATVHLGRLLGPVGFSRTVAIKRLHPHYAKDPEFVSMFLDEAKLASRIRHPNVVATLDIVARKGELFLVMDYVQGESLSKLMKLAAGSGDKVPLGVATSIVLNLLAGLHAAHEAHGENGEPLNIVHRDISPQNVLVGVDGIARVVDFGVAKAAVRVQTTREGQLKGKLAYMAPEQLISGEVDRRVDVYAASVVMWELLTGRTLFAGDDARVVYRIIHENPMPPSQINPDIPPALDAIVLRGLSRKPDERYSSADAMAEEIVGCTQPSYSRVVGQWVARTARATLDSRANMVAELESSTALEAATTSRMGDDADPPTMDSTESKLSEATSGAASRASSVATVPPPRRAHEEPTVADTDPPTTEVGAHEMVVEPMPFAVGRDLVTPAALGIDVDTDAARFGGMSQKRRLIIGGTIAAAIAMALAIALIPSGAEPTASTIEIPSSSPVAPLSTALPSVAETAPEAPPATPAPSAAEPIRTAAPKTDETSTPPTTSQPKSASPPTTTVTPTTSTPKTKVRGSKTTKTKDEDKYGF